MFFLGFYGLQRFSVYKEDRTHDVQTPLFFNRKKQRKTLRGYFILPHLVDSFTYL